MRTTLRSIEHSSTPSTAEIFTLQSDEIEGAWWWIRTFLAKVSAYDWTEDDVRRDLIAGKAQVWAAIGATGEPRIDGIWITRIETTPTKKWGLVWIAAGSPVEQGIELFLAHTEPWFREIGCQFVQIVGRAGWSRMLDGYTEEARMYVKELV